MAALSIGRDGLILAAVAVAALWIVRRGVAGAASDAGTAAVNAAGGAVSGAVGAVSVGLGIPTPADTTTDARVARWLIDNEGYLTASLYSGAPALFSAMGMAAGTGTPPPAGSPAALAAADRMPSTGNFARMDRETAIDLGDPWRLGAPGWEGLPTP